MPNKKELWKTVALAFVGVLSGMLAMRSVKVLQYPGAVTHLVTQDQVRMQRELTEAKRRAQLKREMQEIRGRTDFLVGSSKALVHPVWEKLNKLQVLYHAKEMEAVKLESELVDTRRHLCSAPLDSFARKLECAEKDLKPGRLAFEPKKTMEQWQREPIFIRISAGALADLNKGFREGPPTISSIQVSPVMRARLLTQPDEFAVQQIGDEEKVLKAPYTDWSWYVTPLEGGEKKMDVLVYSVLMLPDGSREPFEAFAGSASIYVHVRPIHTMENFIQKNWMWLAWSAMILGAIGLLINRRRMPQTYRSTPTTVIDSRVLDVQSKPGQAPAFNALFESHLKPREVFISYAWGDDTPAGKIRAATVDRLYSALIEDGFSPIRDRDQMRPGERVSSFIRQLTRADLVVTVISDKYLRSPYCMFEIYRLWERCQEDPDELARCVVPIVLEEVKIEDIEERATYVRHWSARRTKLEDLRSELGSDLGHESWEELRLVYKFAQDVDPILCFLKDVRMPRKLEAHLDDGFQAVRVALRRRIEADARR